MSVNVSMINKTPTPHSYKIKKILVKTSRNQTPSLWNVIDKDLLGSEKAHPFSACSRL